MNYFFFINARFSKTRVQGLSLPSNEEKKNDEDMDYSNSSLRFRPLGSRVMALSIKYHSLALRTESREECEFSLVGLTACQYENG